MTTGQERITRVTVAGGRHRTRLLAAGLPLSAVGLWWVLSRGVKPGAALTVDPTSRFLLAVSLIVLVCQGLGLLFTALGQGAVVGEMLGGILLGPSAFGALAPGTFHKVFTKDVLADTQMAANLGLVVFMFLLGTELRPQGLGVRASRLAVVAGGATFVPFLAGLALAWPSRGFLAVPHVRPVEYVLFIALALSVTAVPVLARLIVDLNLSGTEAGKVSLACAAIGDAAVWGGLTMVMALAAADGGRGRIQAVVVATGVLAIVLLMVVRPLLALLAGAAKYNSLAARLFGPVLVVGAIVTSAATETIGLHPVSGAFLFGVVAPAGSPALRRMDEQLRGFTITILLPLFFAGIGLTTSIGLLGTSPAHWLFFLGLLAVAVVAKFAGATGGARAAGLPTYQSLRVGALMNCRGVTELIVISIGWQIHVVSALGVTILVLVALLTTGATPYAVRLAFGRDMPPRDVARRPAPMLAPTDGRFGWTAVEGSVHTGP